MRLSTIIDTAERTITGLHKAVFAATDGSPIGRLIGRVGPMPVVRLTTIGRKSGQRRTTMLTSPLREGDNVILVASRGGAPRHPDWFLNLRDNPHVELTVDGTTTPMIATVASAAEKDRLWPMIVRRYPGYGLYQLRSRRDIPVVILEPSP